MLTKVVLANRLTTDQILAVINCDQAHALLNSVFSLVNAQAKAASDGKPDAKDVAAAAPAAAAAAAAPAQTMEEDTESVVSED